MMERDAAWFEAQAVEALFSRGLGHPLSPRLLRRLRESGIDLSRPLSPVYPRETVEAALGLAAEELSPGESAAQAHRRLGERLVRGFLSSFRARAVVSAARAIGTDRAIARATGTHRTPSNFLQVQLARERAGNYRVQLSWRPPHPELLEGICSALLVALGAREVVVEPGPEQQGCTELALRFLP